jgi:hypothetical protein
LNEVEAFLTTLDEDEVTMIEINCETLGERFEPHTTAIRAYIAAGCETSPERLSRLALSGDARIRQRVAENMNTPAGTLIWLAKDGSADIRLAVSANPNCPMDVTFAMAQDTDPTVRYGLAEDANAPLEVLRILACDENPYVRCRAEKTIQALQTQAVPGPCKLFIKLLTNQSQARYA